MLLEKDEDQVGAIVSKKKKLHGVKEERNMLQTMEIRKAYWFGHILCRNCVLKRVTENRVEK